MIRAPARAILALTFMLMAVAALGWAVVHPKNDASAPLQESRRPPLLLLTSLPLIFGEDFSLNGGGSIALKALQSRYRVLPISTTSPSELKRARLLLMAQPQPDRGKPCRAGCLGAAGRAGSLACRPAARMAEQAAAWGSIASDPHIPRHRIARPLGTAARPSQRAGNGHALARRAEHHGCFSRATERFLPDYERRLGRSLPHRRGASHRRRGRRLPGHECASSRRAAKSKRLA